jgi:hypothetical protein
MPEDLSDLVRRVVFGGRDGSVSSSTSARAEGEDSSASSHVKVTVGEEAGSSAATIVTRAQQDGIEIVSTAAAQARAEEGPARLSLGSTLDLDLDGKDVIGRGVVEAKASLENPESAPHFLDAETDVRASSPGLIVDRVDEVIVTGGDQPSVSSTSSFDIVDHSAPTIISDPSLMLDLHLPSLELPFAVV